MKVKSSVILEECLRLIETGEQIFVCAAIQDVETQIRWDNNGENVSSKAMKVFEAFRPKTVPEVIKLYGEWWPKKSPDRIVALKAAIEVAKKQND